MNEQTERMFENTEKLFGNIFDHVADRAGCSPEIMRRILRIVWLMRDNARAQSAENGKHIVELMKHLGDLERKARRYDLLIEAEKNGEAMAGK